MSFPEYMPSQPEPLIPARLPLRRPSQGRWLCGVCKGLSLHLGIPVVIIRLLFLISAMMFGSGIVAYVFLWITVPAGDPVAAARQEAFWQAEEAGRMPLSRGNAPRKTGEDAEQPKASGAETGLADTLAKAPKAAVIALAGAALTGVCLLLLLTGISETYIAPIALALAAVGIAWLYVNNPERQVGSLMAGITVLFIAVLAFAVANFHTGLDIARVMILVLFTLIAVGLMLVPWATTMSRRLSQEQASKEREEERADMAAHLHDGVLQTLALIQLHSAEPQTVFSLARSQERELREWLYQERTTTDRSVLAGIKELAATVEDEFGKPIEVVTVGDAQPSAQTDALLDATAQALRNAVAHGGEPISVYAEAQSDKVEVFVRDHGTGFDVNAIPPDRLGIRESIIGRIQRRGGSVEIVSRPNWGTEVRMHMPISALSSSTHNQPERNDLP